MPALVYIHGFLSSPLSQKAVQVRDWLVQHRPDIEYHCPYLTVYPAEVQTELCQLVERLLPEPVYLVGSSMGGFWSTYLSETYNLKAVLINPAVRPHEHMPAYIGMALKNFHTADTYELQTKHMDELRAADKETLKYPNNYWLMVQSGDETLDYRHAVEKYQGCRQLVEEGGSHAFDNFEQWIPEVINFLEK